MKLDRVLFRLIAAVLAAVLCLATSGCSELSSMMEMIDMMQENDVELLEDGADIYSLSMFDSLPQDYSSADPLFWVAEGKNGGRVYLLGSIHIADEQAYRIPKHIMEAYLESDALAVECDIVAAESDIMGQLELMDYYMYTDGSTIEDHVSAELYQAMTAYFENNPSELLESYGYSLDVLNGCKPSMWQSAFETMLSEKAGLDSEMGIDRHFLMLSKSMEKEIIEVESVEFQASLFDTFSDDLNELLLWDYVSNDADEYADYYYESYKSWLEGDAAFFFTETQVDYSQSGMTDDEIAEYEALLENYNNALLHERNTGMADTAEQMLESGQNVFYIVGLAHMGGASGIVTQLRERGWTVTQLGGQDADPYTTPGVPVPTETVVADGSGDDDDSSQQPEQSSTAASELDDYYDLYVELYEHFGGTTRPASSTTTASDTASDEDTTTTRTTSTTSSGDSWFNWGN